MQGTWIRRLPKGNVLGPWSSDDQLCSGACLPLASPWDLSQPSVPSCAPRLPFLLEFYLSTRGCRKYKSKLWNYLKCTRSQEKLMKPYSTRIHVGTNFLPDKTFCPAGSLSRLGNSKMETPYILGNKQCTSIKKYLKRTRFTTPIHPSQHITSKGWGGNSLTSQAPYNLCREILGSSSPEPSPMLDGCSCFESSTLLKVTLHSHSHK